MKTASLILWAIGLFFVLALIGQEGFHKMGVALSTVGFGMLWVSFYRFVPMFLDAVAWRQLFAPGRKPPFFTITVIRWVGESVNSLLPVAQVGGDVVRARLVAKRYALPRSACGAATVVDFTLALVAHAVFSFCGLGLLLTKTGLSEPVAAFTVGILVAALIVGTLHFAPRLGLFGILAELVEKVAHKDPRLEKLAGGVQALHEQVIELHQRGFDLLLAFFLKLAGWVLRVFETWLVLKLMGYPVDVGQAFIIESLAAAVRSASFFMPGGLGLQEGGIMVLGHILGLSTNASLGLAVIKRVREMATGLPGLVVWSYLEHRGFKRLLTADLDSDLDDPKNGNAGAKP